MDPKTLLSPWVFMFKEKSRQLRVIKVMTVSFSFNSGPLRSRHQERISCAGSLQGERPVKDEERGNKRRQGAPPTVMRV